MIRAYCGVREECTEEQVQVFESLLSKARFEIVFMHVECFLPNTLEQSPEDIDESERRNPDGSNFPLQPGCVYAYTPLSRNPNPGRQPVINLLSATPRNPRDPIIMHVSCALPQEADYRDLPFPVYKDIIFKSESSQSEVGWYNKRTNILWLSDLFHFMDNSKNTIPGILNAVAAFQSYGRVPELLTIGADPEFEIVNSEGDLIDASSVMPGGAGANVELGVDGVSSTGELRPKHSNSPLGLTRNIKRIMRRLANLSGISEAKVRVGGGVHVTTGGHIHFGIKNLPQPVRDMLYEMVGRPVLYFQSEKRAGAERSNWEKNSHGLLRDQPHGLEWRALPSFIVNEEVTAAVLSTAYAIIKSWRYHGFIKNYGGPGTPVPIAEDYYDLPLYSAYKDQIDIFIKYFIDKEVPINWLTKNIVEEWKIPTIKRRATVEIITQAEWLSNYFVSVNVKLKNRVTIDIRFSGDIISTFGIPFTALDKLTDFADRYFLPPVNVQTSLPPGQPYQIIYLPASWFQMTGRSAFCEAFKHVLKDIILKLGNS